VLNFTPQEISLVINIALATRKIRKLTTFPGKKIRCDLHILFQGAIGSGKSTLLYEIGKHLKVMPQTSLTKATILGSIDKTTGTVTLPTVWRLKLSTLLIDEIHINNSNKGMIEVMDAFLSLMEFGEYEKAIGYRCNNLIEEDDKNFGLYLKVENNIIKCKTRFIFFGNTMYNMRDTRSTQLQAFATRCLIIPYYPNDNETYDALDGKELFHFKDLKVKKQDVKITKKQHEQIKLFMREKKIHGTRLRRFFGDLCRITAVLGKIDLNVFEIVYKMLTIQLDDLEYVNKQEESNKWKNK